MQKAMFFDIDGTLMEDTREHFIPESTLHALKLARSAGHLLFVNTGRPLVNVDDDVRRLGFDGYVCGCGTYVEWRGTEIFYRTNPAFLCQETAELVRRCNASPMYERRDVCFFDAGARQLPLIDEIRNIFRAQEKNISRQVCDQDFGFDKFIVAYDEKTDLEQFFRSTKPFFDFIDRGWGFAEMTPRGLSKKTGMDILLQHCGIARENCYAVGDSLNDKPMFEGAGTSIAMGNGEKLIPFADYVTAPLREDGIYLAMKRFGFFEA